MTILIVGARGATGIRLVEELLNREIDVKVIVRSPEELPETIRHHKCLSVIHENVLELSGKELEKHVVGWDAVASCLVHNATFKGVYGKPRFLVT